MCDIEGMFLQVFVPVRDRNFLRFLWWEDDDFDKPPVEFRMKVHLFGATSSPGCANFALKTTADDFEKEWGGEAAAFVTNDFYVDDGLTSVPNPKKAIALVQDTKGLCSTGGFNLHKFISNSKEVNEAIPKDQRASVIQDLDMSRGVLPIEKALGIQWCVESDQLRFRVELKDRPLTRRGILASVSSTYDPLGLVATFLLIGKSILQELCRSKTGWDEAVPDSVRPRWEKWRSELHELAELNVPRCYKPENFGEVKTIELQSFSDASICGYGQCSYLRMVNSQGEIHCSLVMAKSRVTPLKPITVPRLELTAAVLSTKALHTFVANRVQHIRDHTSPDQWEHIDTDENPADDASRGLHAQELISSTRWWKGPAILWNPLGYRSNDHPTFDVSPEDPEVRKVTVFACDTQQYPTLLERLECFSDWHRAKKALAICLIYMKKLKGQRRHLNEATSKENGQQSLVVTVEDMQSSEHIIFKIVQSHHFSKESELLHGVQCKEGKAVGFRKAMKKTSPIHRLDPFLDECGVLRVGGRIDLANLPYEVRHPVILPKRSHVTDMVIRHYHQQAKHQGQARTHSEIRRSDLWIVGGRSTVRRHVAKCVTCRRLRGATQQQKMADLPKDRLQPSPPFTYSAVDCFGPWYVKEGRKELKRYGVLFTCMNSRAVHLEVAATLTTDSFLSAYRRFVGRRGPVRQLRSDQGTNFVGARNELEAALAEMHQDVIQRELLKDNCDWITFRMNVPHASHMGGVWERQIRTVRNVLEALLLKHGRQLNDESLRTLMVEAEAIVNSRPLTTNDLSEPDSLSALTPSHLLTMRSKVVLPPPGNFQGVDVYSRKHWHRVQHLANEFWEQWRRSYLQTLQCRRKWTSPHDSLHIGDVVIVKDDGAPRNRWPLSRVYDVYPDEDGHVRTVKVVMANPSSDLHGKQGKHSTFLDRPVHKLVLLMRGEDGDRGIPNEEP